MELAKKTTILFSRELHARLTRLAAERNTTMGDLVRRACEQVYTADDLVRRRAAAQRLTSLGLPVADVATMKRQSVPDPRDILPEPD